MKLSDVKKNQFFKFKNQPPPTPIFKKVLDQEDSAGRLLVLQMETHEYWLLKGNQEVELSSKFCYGDKVKVNWKSSTLNNLIVLKGPDKGDKYLCENKAGFFVLLEGNELELE